MSLSPRIRALVPANNEDEMQLTVGTWKHCHWQCLRGSIDEAGWTSYIEHLIALEPRLVAGDVILDLWHDTGRPSPKDRERFTSRFAKAAGLERITAHAFVTNSAVSRGVLTAVNWVVRRPFDEKLFASPDAGLAWLKERDAGFDADGLRAELTTKIPDFRALRW